MKYRNEGITYSYKLNNDYFIFVMARYDFDEDCHKLTFYLKEKSTQMLDFIDCGDYETVRCGRTILPKRLDEIITRVAKTGYFDKFIKRFEYQMLCFDKGIDYFEEKGCESYE